MKFTTVLTSLFVSLLFVSTGNAQVSDSQIEKAKLEAYISFPSPSGLTSSGSKMAWVMNETGERNVYVAEAPNYKPRRLTDYKGDVGQDLTSLTISPDGKWVVFERGGEHGGNWSNTVTANPESLYESPAVEIWAVPFEGGKPKKLAAGHYPKISPKSNELFYLKNGQLWRVPIDGSASAKRLFTDKGNVQHAQWSPSGDQIVFSSSRTTHSFIGVWSRYKKAIQWIAPAFSNDIQPKWSPDERSIAFVRLPGKTNEKFSILERRHQPWEIQVADLESGAFRLLWKAPTTLAGSIPTTSGRYNLNWVAGGRVVFLSYHDGWPHLYSISAEAGQAEEPILLTPGDFMVEEVRVSPDLKQLIFSANTGDDPSLDIDRRHIAVASVDRPDMRMLTTGSGVETTPTFLEDGKTVAFLSSTYNRPALPAVMPVGAKKFEILASDKIGKALASMNYVVPEQVIYTAEDGVRVHAQLFEKKDGKTNKPAIVFVHGGPERQMMLSWDHRRYYAHTYAMNQYFADAGYVVLSVNYRLGIGYGYEFHKPANANRFGASEYKDIKAAGEWLRDLPQVDKSRIGIYGGSYGGFLTAHALGRDSDLFAAGVDIHGVHSRVPDQQHASLYEKAPDAAEADRVAWESSPIAYVDTWKSPVLLIHADDDRNVGFAHSVDLAQRLSHRGVDMEILAIPDDNHHWFLHRNLVKVSWATVDFFNRKIGDNN